MDSDRIEGAVKMTGGKIEKQFGRVIGDHKIETDGMIDQLKGSAQNLYGSAKDSVKSAIDGAPPKVRDGAYQTIEVVRANPLLSAILAGTVGYALSLAMRQETPLKRKKK